MTENTTKYLDLDAVDLGPKLVIKLKGIQHELKPASVADFIANTKLVQSMGVNVDMETEIDTIITMLIRAFPTMTREMLLELNVNALNQLFAFAQENDGSKKVEEEAKAEAEANPQTAGA